MKVEDCGTRMSERWRGFGESSLKQNCERWKIFSLRPRSWHFGARSGGAAGGREAVSRCRSTVRSKFWRLSHDDMQQQVHQPLTLSNILFSWLIFCDRPWHLLVLVRGILKIRAIGVEVIKEFLYVIRVNVTRLTRAKRGLQFKMKTTNGWYYMMIS